MFGVTPFVSHRSPGAAAGIVAAGGGAGAAVLQAAFFYKDGGSPAHKAFMWMGGAVMALSLPVVALRFPMW